jgi:hypothetical protein
MKASTTLIRASLASFATISAMGAISIFMVSCGKDSKGSGGGAGGPTPAPVKTTPYTPNPNNVGGYYPPNNGSIIDLPQGTNPLQSLQGDWVAAQADSYGTSATINFGSGGQFSASNFDKGYLNQGWNSPQNSNALTGTYVANIQQNIIVIDLKTAGNGQGGYNPYDPYNPGQPGQPGNPYNPGQPGQPYDPYNPGQPGNPNFPGNIARTINCIGRIGSVGAQSAGAASPSNGREALQLRCNFSGAGYPQSFDNESIIFLRGNANQPIYR